MSKLLFFLWIAVSYAQPVSVDVSATPQQAIVHYQRPDATPCSLEVSESSALQPLINDVNPMLFPGANLDNRDPNNIVTGNDVQFVVGYRGVAKAVDNRIYSRSLQAYTTHYYRLTCGAGQDMVTSGTFTTLNVPVGNTAPDPIAYQDGVWGGWPWPTIDFSNPGQEIIDPQTGFLLKRFTNPGDEPLLYANVALSEAIPSGSGWSNLRSSQGNIRMEYSGNGGDFLFLWGYDGINRPGLTDVGAGSYSNQNALDDARLTLTAYSDKADTAIAVCLTQDQQTCVGNPIIASLPQAAADLAFPPAAFPVPLFHGWGDPQIRMDAASTVTYPGSLDTVQGNQVTTKDHLRVTLLQPGMIIEIPGTAPACPDNRCHISSIEDEQHLTIAEQIPNNYSSVLTTLASPVEAGATVVTATSTSRFVKTGSAGAANPVSTLYAFSLGSADPTVLCSKLLLNTFSGCRGIAHAHAATEQISQAVYVTPALGFLVWKTSGSGKVIIDGAHADWAISGVYDTDYQGAEGPWLTATTVNATYAADGVTPITPTPGYIAYFHTKAASSGHLFWVNQDTGESRKLSDIQAPGLASFSLSDANPLTFYYFDGTDLQSCAYDVNNATYGRFRSFQTPYSVRGTPFQNPAISCTAANQGDVPLLIKSACPSIDTTYSPYLTATSIRFPLATFSLASQQNGPAWYVSADFSKPAGQQIQRCVASWGQQIVYPSTTLTPSYPYRWNEGHGNVFWFANDWEAINAQVPYLGWDLKVSRLSGNAANTALTSTFVDPLSCQQLGVLDPRWIALGATGSTCIQMDVATEPLETKAPASDLMPLGSLPVGARPAAWIHNASVCNGDGTTTACASFLQPLAEGDYIGDESQSYDHQGGELFLVAKKTLNPDGSIHLVLARGMNPPGCNMTTQAHAAGWVPYMRPPGSCGLGFYYHQISNSSNFILDNQSVNQGHNVQWVNGGGSLIDVAPFQSPPWEPSALGGAYQTVAVRKGTFPNLIQSGAPYNYDVPGIYQFNGSQQGMTSQFIQTHPGGLTYAAPPGEQDWVVDGRPYGGGTGGAFNLWNITTSKIGGFNNVYKITPPEAYDGTLVRLYGDSYWTAAWDPKRRTIYANAGNQNLRDISGPQSSLTDTLSFTRCYALLANECVAGSQAGDMFVNVPMVSPTSLSSGSALGTCTNNMDIFSLCVTGGPNEIAAGIQFAVDAHDTKGRMRVLSRWFGGPGQTSNYWNVHASPDGKWAISTGLWMNGVRSDLFGLKLTPFQEDSIARQDFTSIPIYVPGQPNTSARIRFGYDYSLFCGQRNEQCSTAVGNSDPFAWLSEPQQWISCSSDCYPVISAISSRVLYYVIDRRSTDGSVTTGPITVGAIP